MYRRTVRMTYSQALIDALLDALSAAPEDPLLTTPELILFTNNTTVTPTTALASLNQPTFTGYAPAEITLAGPYAIGGFDRAMVASLRFECTATPEESVPIYGVAISDGDTVYYGGELFDELLNIEAAGQFIDYDLILPLPSIYQPTIS